MYFEEESLDIGQENNCKKVNVPNLTVYYVNNCGEAEKDENLVSYGDIKILALVNRIKDASRKRNWGCKGRKSRFRICFLYLSQIWGGYR